MNRFPSFLADNATIQGDTQFGSGTSVWFHAVIRADEDTIEIGEGSNIQDGCILHTDEGEKLVIGDHVSVGHGAILHGCTIEDGALIGMGSILLNGARIEKNAMTGAGTLVPGGMTVPEGMLAMGSPARIIRALTPEEIAANLHNAVQYEKTASRELNHTAQS